MNAFDLYRRPLKQIAWVGLLALLFMPLAQAEPLRLSPPPSTATQDQPAPPQSYTPTVTPDKNALKLQIRKHGVSKALLYRRLQPQRYQHYEEKTKSIGKTLKETLSYLESLNVEPHSLQRLSAFSAEASLDWSDLENNITPAEKSFHSYQDLKTAVEELHSLVDYWMAANRTRQIFRGTLEDQKQDEAILHTKMEKIRTALKQLQDITQLKKDLDTSTPY